MFKRLSVRIGKPKEPEPVCAFCKRVADPVNKLIASPADARGKKTYICDRCIGVFNDILKDGGKAVPK